MINRVNVYFVVNDRALYQFDMCYIIKPGNGDIEGEGTNRRTRRESAKLL